MFAEGKHLVCGGEEQWTLSGEGKQLVKSIDDDRQGEKDQSALGTAHATKSENSQTYVREDILVFEKMTGSPGETLPLICINMTSS